jgi:hypothetical protein
MTTSGRRHCGSWEASTAACTTSIRFDKYDFLPSVRGYEFIVPTLALKEPPTFSGTIESFGRLQQCFPVAGKEVSSHGRRYLTNSTLEASWSARPGHAEGRESSTGTSSRRWAAGSSVPGPTWSFRAWTQHDAQCEGRGGRGHPFRVLHVADPLTCRPRRNHSRGVSTLKPSMQCIGCGLAISTRYPYSTISPLLYCKWDEMLIMK